MKKGRVKGPILIDNRYKTLKKLGSGAMGDVYKVRDLKDQRIIALKMLSKERTSSEAVKRFKREFKLLAGLHHPNLCSVYDFGILKDGRSYFTMEYIDGKDIFKASKGLPYKKIYPWIIQLCRVLEYIHSKGLIHYDIKPSNVLVAEDKEQGVERNNKPYAQGSMPSVKLMDFGLTGEQRIKGGVTIKGTFPYIAPEVIKGLAVDQRAELYSLGVLLYEIFTHGLFRATAKESFVTLLKQRRDWVSKLPSKTVPNIPKMIDQLILRLLASEPAQRYSRANEVIREINKLSHSKYEFETEKTLEGYLLSSRFVGCTKEMTLLKSLYEQARQGEGKVVLITGDAGIGKSRLLKEFKISAQLQRSHCFTGSAYRDRVGSLEPFYEIFKELINYIKFRSNLSRELKLSFAVLFKLFPDLTDEHLKKKLPKLVPLEPKQEKLRTFEALSELIGHCALRLGELIILLEDLHWADNLSILFLEYLDRNLKGKNIFICGTCRKEELKENIVLKRVISNLRKEDCFTQVELGPLGFRNLYSFLDSTVTSGSNSSELVRYLMKKTGGNPFFVQEIMRTLLQKRKVIIGERIGIEHFKRISIPETIEEIVLKRIKGLDSASRKVVNFGAVLLKDFSYALMKSLTGLDDTELSRALWELKRRQILIEEGNRYRFYHATLREAVNKRLGYREKRELNYQVGKVLEVVNRGKFEKAVEDLAYYFINAKDRKKGVSYGLMAARKSSDRFANEQAIRFYKGVLGLLGDKEPRRRFDILQKLAYIEDLASYYDDEIKHYYKALSLKIGAIDQKIKVYCSIGAVYESKGKFNDVLYIYQKAARLLKKMKPSQLKVLLEADIGAKICRAYLKVGDYESASKFNFDIMQLPKSKLKGKEAIRLLGSIYSCMGEIEFFKRDYSKRDCSKREIDKVFFYLNKAYKHYREIKDERNISRVLNILGIYYYFELEFQKAISCYKKAILVSEKIGDQYGGSIILINLGSVLHSKGLYSNAVDCFQKALVISKKIGNPAMIGASFTGLTNCFSGLCNYRMAREYSEKALKTFHAAALKQREIYSLSIICSIYQITGDYTIALRSCRKALRISREIKYQHGLVMLFSDMSSVFIDIGEFSKAKRYIKKVLKIIPVIGTRYIEIDCYMHLCRVNIIMKDYAAAKDCYEKGIKIAKESGMREQTLQFLISASEIYYHEKGYLKGIKVANKGIKLAREMGAKDLYAMALLVKARNGVKQGILSKIKGFRILDKAKEIAEEIGCPEVLWRVYFEYGRFLQNDRRFRKALDYYQRCCEIFEDVGSKIKNESYKRSYLSHPDRQAVFAATNELEKLLD